MADDDEPITSLSSGRQVIVIFDNASLETVKTKKGIVLVNQ